VTAFVLATANPDKAEEITSILAVAGSIELLPRPEWLGEVAETGSTLLDNARLKARAVARATGMAAIADDTGLEVDALDGAPGVHSSRFAGEGASYADNVAKLLAELEGKREASARRARFRTVAVVAWPDGKEVVAEGEVKGTIALAPKGKLGFGYDPVFVPDDAGGTTFAEMVPAV
jgi:XTP/dITP diphosphohydrolase